MAIGLGSVVIPEACIAAGTAVIFGTAIAVGETGADHFDVLWENGQIALDVDEDELHEFWSANDAAITHPYRPATVEASGGGAVAPGPDNVGIVVARSSTETVIRTLAGHRYLVNNTAVQYTDV